MASAIRDAPAIASTQVELKHHRKLLGLGPHNDQ